MVHVSVLFPVEDLIANIEAGLVRVQTHPVLPYKIYNYNEQVQYGKKWNEVTLNCRGLILDDNYNIIARPWKKFFNLGEGYIQFGMEDPVEVTDKMDGSLGILYPLDEFGNCEIATRGSFASEQALHATQVWRERYADLFVDDSLTFLFEIIYKENRIVLNYGDMDDLVLLGAVNKQHGYYIGPNEAAAWLGWDGPVTQTFEYRTMQEAFNAADRPNAEGFVIRCGNKQVKLKQTDYVELHRIVTNLSAKTIWERLSAGETVENILDAIPDEFHGFVQEIADDLNRQYKQYYGFVLDEADLIWDELPENFTRKEFALRAQKSQYAKFMFLMLDNKSIDTLVWQQIKPKMEADDARNADLQS